ncbi:MAG TPA: transglycosylase SLT domain-containing protein [Pyrinomonadaceae bacterium]|nr:transglycosylase SLT domain-containing protein [Pyrinomonadaceae bacterium]
MLSKTAAFVFTTIFVFTLFTVGCSAQPTEEQTLANLRQMSRDGLAPTDSYIASIESRFSGTRTGLLAKLLRAKMKFDNKDFTGAAALLNTNDFRTKTKIADHALWLRGWALQQSGDHAGAMIVFAQLINEFPDSIRVTDARLKWADSATKSGQALNVPSWLARLSAAGNADANRLTAEAYESQGNQPEAIRYYRRAYFFGAGTDSAKTAEAKLTSMSQPLAAGSADELIARGDKLLAARDFAGADKAYTDLSSNFPTGVTSAVRVRHLTALAGSRKAVEAQTAFNAIPSSANEKEEAYYQLTLAYARARMWPQARTTAEEMRGKYPNGKLTAKAWADAGSAARDAKSNVEAQAFFRAAVVNFPNAVEVAGAQFDMAWQEHDRGNFALSSKMFTEHLARYAEKDTTNRGKAGYWSARDSERAGKTAEACALYEGVISRYSANWYGYLAQQRLSAMSCPAGAKVDPLVAKAVAALKTITVAKETSTAIDIARTEKSEELSTIALFDWANDELNEARRSAQNSPSVSLALARFFRLKGDNVNALLALAKSYPDYSQMNPEEMGRDEWEIFYPLSHWNDIKYWAGLRNLDKYQVAGLIRQESVFDPRARSHAKAYGLMQLLVPTAQTMARKYASKTPTITSDVLFQAPLNIELGTAFMRDQFDKFGKLEYVAVAYNAGPGRVPQWRANLPIEIDEFVEAIPFKETRGYVQGVVRNTAQYRRLYDDAGNFKPNVGTSRVGGVATVTENHEEGADTPVESMADGGEEQ